MFLLSWNRKPLGTNEAFVQTNEHLDSIFPKLGFSGLLVQLIYVLPYRGHLTKCWWVAFFAPTHPLFPACNPLKLCQHLSATQHNAQVSHGQRFTDSRGSENYWLDRWQNDHRLRAGITDSDKHCLPYVAYTFTHFVRTISIRQSIGSGLWVLC